MITDEALDTEEAQLRTLIEEHEEALRVAKARLHQVGQERLILHKADHQADFEAKQAEVQALTAELKGLIAGSTDPDTLGKTADALSNAMYAMSDAFNRAAAGEDRWDSPARRAMDGVAGTAESACRTAEGIADYLRAAARSDGDRKALFLKTAQDLRRTGMGYDTGGLPCTGCGQPKWDYNDEDYTCRACW